MSVRRVVRPRKVRRTSERLSLAQKSLPFAVAAARADEESLRWSLAARARAHLWLPCSFARSALWLVGLALRYVIYVDPVFAVLLGGSLCAIVHQQEVLPYLAWTEHIVST